jgi:geranylgeranyl diphosphate synthase type I
LNDEFRELLEYAKHIAERVNKDISGGLKGDPKKLYDASYHLIRAGGKRLRPLALVLSGRMYGLSEDIGVMAGSAVEILHNFTLIHDDIMDKDSMRRGVPTVHTLYGVDMAILAGDLLFAKSFEALSRVEGYVHPQSLINAYKELAWAAVTVAEGQALDMSFEERIDVTIDDYITMVFKKTAALFKSSLVMGAYLAGASDEEIEKLTEFGTDIGIAFQIRDDILGLVGDEKVLGKPVYSDLREGKKTILVIYALQKLEEKERDYILSRLGKRDLPKEELEKVAEMIKSTGAVEYADELSEKYIKDGLEALDSTNPVDGKARELLQKLAIYITKRKY